MQSRFGHNRLDGSEHFKLITMQHGKLSQVCLWLLILAAACSKDKTVAPEVPGPEANAGEDQVLYLPDPELTLDGSKSIHPKGNIATYRWAQIDGISRASFANANAAVTRVTNLIRGPYKFELLVTDTRGKSDRDTVSIQVKDEILKENAVLLTNLAWECPWGCSIIIKNVSTLLPPQKKLAAAYYRDQWYMPWQLVYSELGNVPSGLECGLDNDELFLYDPNETKVNVVAEIALIYR